jgi:hypothetical protein
MENLKSRINRCAQIINSFENIPQAITVRSSRLYPDKKVNGMTRSLYYDDVCDFKLAKNYMIPKTEINTRPYNQIDVLGKRPDGTLEDVKLTQEILNTIDCFKEVKNEFVSQSGVFKDLSESQEIPSDIERFNSLFNYYDKTKVYGIKTNTNVIDSRESNLLNNFMNAKKPKQGKKLQDAPVSITDNVKMTQYKTKRELIRRNNNKSIDVNLPENLNLPMISQFEVQTSPLEDYFTESDVGIYAPQEQIYGDDNYDLQMPLDIIKNFNRKKSKEHVDTKKITESSVLVKENKIPSMEQSKNITLSNYSENKPTNKTAPSFTPVQAIPSVPLVPSIPNIPKIPAIPNIPSIPVVPQVPLNFPKPEPAKEQIKQAKIEKPLVDFNAKANLLDEIRSENPMARLKKLGAVSTKADPKPEPSKQTGNDQNSMVIFYLYSFLF